MVDADILGIILTFAAAIFGTLMGNSKTIYRIDQLEKKVEKHNNLVERTYGIEKRLEVHDEQFRVANHRIKDLEDIE